MAQQNPQAAGSGQTNTSDDDLVTGQPLQALAVGGPVGGAAGRDAPVVVKVYALGRGVSFVREGLDLARREGSFELEANGVLFVFDPAAAGEADGLVVAVEGDVAPVGLTVEAVDQEQISELGGIGLDLNRLEVGHRVVRQLLAARSELRGAASASTCRRDCQFPGVYDAIEAFMDRDMVRLIGEVVALLEGPAGPLSPVPAEAKHGFPPEKTAILSLPPGFGKSILGPQLARALGCSSIVDGWCSAKPLLSGALHLTNTFVAVKGGAE